MISLKINLNDSNQRLDRFILKTFPKFSKSAIYKAIRTKKIKVNSKKSFFNYFLNQNDTIQIYGFENFVCSKKTEKKINLFNLINNKKQPTIVYEDKNLLILNKPSGLSSQPNFEGEPSLISFVWSYLINKNELKLENENSFMPALCNRLDTKTSGLVVAAKNAIALKHFNEIVKNRKIVKLYKCLAEGVFNSKQQTLIGWLKKTKHNKVIIQNKMSKNFKMVELSYVVLKQFEKYALLEINLKTGRTHQIRAQLSKIGHSIVGDLKYGSVIKTSMKLCCFGLIFKTKNSMFDYLNEKKIKIQTNF